MTTRNGAIRGLVTITLLAAATATAQPLDPASTDALAATLRMLQDPALRAAAIAATPQATAVDQQIQSIAGSPALTQEIYALAAQVMSELTRSSGGDVDRMVDALERGKTDPAGFAAMLSPETLERLRELSTKISDQNRQR
jgi:phage-related minor tail protein